MSDKLLNTMTQWYGRNESKIIFVAVLLLSVYLIAFFAKLTWYLVPAEQSANSQNTPQIASGAPNTNSQRSSIQKVLNLNLFGNAAAQPVAQVEEEITEAPETKLNLVLSGVVASNNETRSVAIIEYRNVQDTYIVGDKIEGTNVTLDSIYKDRVIIKNRLSRETLMLEGLDFDDANDNRQQQSQVNTSRQPTVSPNNRPSRQELVQARQQLSQSPDNFSQMVSMAPHRVDGELLGYRVSPGSNPALFNSVGLKSGDIITNLNGLDLTDLQQSLEALAELQEADFLELEILRSGEYISLDFDLEDDSEI